MQTDTHRVQRPQWTCVTDGEPWPCDPARTMMAKGWGDDTDALAGMLTVLMGQAADELHQSDPTRLYRRFVGWVYGSGHGCRICGKRGHDVIPGVPPRLVPCEVAEWFHGLRGAA
jgi:hypothetical protein